MIGQTFSLNNIVSDRNWQTIYCLQVSSDDIEVWHQKEFLKQTSLTMTKQMYLTIHHKKKCTVQSRLVRIEQKAEHSKQLVSIMFRGNAVGEYLQSMVYKVKNVYQRQMIGGPKGTIYDSTPCGWFDMKTFEKQFCEIFLKSSEKLRGPKVITGDNLGCHFSPKVIETCLEKDISFITLALNTTSLMPAISPGSFQTIKNMTWVTKWMAEKNSPNRNNSKRSHSKISESCVCST